MSRTGSVCEKHQEYSPDGVCRWCVPAPEPVVERNIPWRGMDLKDVGTPVPGLRVLPSEAKAIFYTFQVDPGVIFSRRMKELFLDHDPAKCGVCQMMGLQ